MRLPRQNSVWQLHKGLRICAGPPVKMPFCNRASLIPVNSSCAISLSRRRRLSLSRHCAQRRGQIRYRVLSAMPLYSFKALRPVPDAKDFIDIVLSKTQRQTPTVVHNGWPVQRIRQFYLRKVR